MIREATLEDTVQIASLMKHLSYPVSEERMKTRLEKILTHKDYQTFVYEQDQQLIGLSGMMKCFRYESDDSYVRVTTMVVDENYRQQGIGTAMIQHIEKWARDQGLAMITLNSGNREERKQAHQFYIQRGFEPKATGFYKKL
ncbi:GNAT family N-acetyltransferase [Halalkalibacillus halophilus]|uniref:GNAT family N-acetyltransferase n=1 Tax=Halalkalibacillus halophilus TaxID=392827 RepID=UPI00041737B5|nr:GNAT family N-acetyltransferase [Halalkalibacillus halophilus]